MEGLLQFQHFDSQRFFSGKKLVCTKCGPLVDYETKNVLGSKVEVCIVNDATAYNPSTKKDGSTISNLFNKLSVKVMDKTISINVGDQVELENPVCKIWGKYNENLSVVANDVKPVVNASASKGQN